MSHRRTIAWRNRLLAGLAAVWLTCLLVIWCSPSLVAEASQGALVEGFQWRAALACTLLVGGVAATLVSDALRRRLWRFLFTSSAPLNLAVLRVTVFGLLLYGLRSEPIQQAATGAPAAGGEGPPLLAPLLDALPIDSGAVEVLVPVATVITLVALVGLFSRVAAALSAVLSTYLLAIPLATGAEMQSWYPVLGVAALLACCPCGDALSIDALWRALRRADRGRVLRLPRSVRYGLPIRLSMVLLVLAYFAPSFWTLTGADSSLGTTRNEAAAGSPALVGLACIALLAGPAALLRKSTRWTWAVVGLAVQVMGTLTVGAHRYSHAGLFVMFVGWQRGLAKLGRWMFGPQLVVLYDGNCKMCRRTMSVLLALDWLESLDGVSAFQRDEIDHMGLGHLSDDALMRDMHAGERTPAREWRVTKGYQAYQRIAWRVPLLWPTLPLVYLPPVVALGERVYRRVADTRACAVPLRGSRGGAAKEGWSATPLLAIASLLLAIGVVAGLGRAHLDSPLGSLPTDTREAPSQATTGATTGPDQPVLRTQ